MNSCCSELEGATFFFLDNLSFQSPFCFSVPSPDFLKVYDFTSALRVTVLRHLAVCASVLPFFAEMMVVTEWYFLLCHVDGLELC